RDHHARWAGPVHRTDHRRRRSDARVRASVGKQPEPLSGRLRRVDRAGRALHARRHHLAFEEPEHPAQESSSMTQTSLPSAPAETVLDIRNVSKRFGGIQAVNDATLAISAGIVTGVIGPNGSGKSTLFDLITGLDHPDGGDIRFSGRNIARLSPDRINQLGIGRTFQLTRLFDQMTVLENLTVISQRGKADARNLARELLASLGLERLEYEYAGNLSYGQQKLVEFLRLSMNDSSLILLDEP